MHFRGCSGEPNKKEIGYHSGKTDDINFVMNHLRNRFPAKRLFAIGYSLGGNALLKYLAEYQTNPLHAAVTVSVPFDLAGSAAKLNKGISRIYQYRLCKLMQRSVFRKRQLLKSRMQIHKLRELKTFRLFDDYITAPVHGFKGVDDYYHKASSNVVIKEIQTPTLILHAKDDPFVAQNSIPTEDELSSYVSLELSEFGGHVGFTNIRNPFKPEFWLEERIVKYVSKACV